MLPRFTGRASHDWARLSASGIVDRDWGPLDAGLVILALGGALALIGAGRVLRRPLPAWPFAALAVLPLLTSGEGPARFGVAATVVSGAGYAHGLLQLGRWRRPARWKRYLGYLALCLAGGGWLGWSVGGWAALAVGGLAAAGLPMAWRALGPPSVARRAPAVVAPLVVGLLTAEILAYIMRNSLDLRLVLPAAGPWWLAAPLLGALGLPGVFAARHAPFRASLAGVAAAGAVALALSGRGVERLALVPLAALTPTVTGDPRAPEDVDALLHLSPWAPATTLLEPAAQRRSLLVRAPATRGPRLTFGAVRLSPAELDRVPTPLVGTVADVLSRCGEPCVVHTRGTEHQASASRVREWARRELRTRRRTGRTDGLAYLRDVALAQNALSSEELRLPFEAIGRPFPEAIAPFTPTEPWVGEAPPAGGDFAVLVTSASGRRPWVGVTPVTEGVFVVLAPENAEREWLEDIFARSSPDGPGDGERSPVRGWTRHAVDGLHNPVVFDVREGSVVWVGRPDELPTHRVMARLRAQGMLDDAE